MKYLVIGYYDVDIGQVEGDRWADSYEAASPQEVEQMAREDSPEINIAGVVALIDGDMQVVA